MDNSGIYLFLVAIILIIAIPIINHYLPFKIKNNYYLFWLPISIFVLIWFIGFRWAYDLSLLINHSYTNIYEQSLRWSKVLLLDLCPLSTVVLSLSLMVDKTRNIAKVVAPITFIGGLVTLFSFVVNIPSDFNTIPLWQYILVGTNNNQIYYLMHLINCMLAIGVITATKTYTKYSICGTFIFYFLWIAYMQICIQTLNITNNATGMVKGDWYIPENIDINYWYCEYGFVYELWPLSFPTITTIWYIICLFINFLIMYIWNRFCCENALISKKWPYWYHKFKSLYFLKNVDVFFERISDFIPNFFKNKH